ncbi:hypothetical protein K435DRAFT_642655, partial [Dendrothele bispora CBS 962.96]
GMTIHSWGAVSPVAQDIDSVIKCIKTCKPAFQRWKKTKVLIIDEGFWVISCYPRTRLIVYVCVTSFYGGRSLLLAVSGNRG